VSSQLIAGRYRLGRRLGMGGMSTVHLAVDERLERQVAVKLLAEHLAADEAFVARFRREALAVARLVHPNIVQVFDAGLDERSGRQYIVMEYVTGQSCAEILRDRRRLGVDDTLDVITQSCRGLDYAHRNGVVHRDVKPGNLLVADDGQVKLADFGIAKATEQSSITQVGSVLGTAAYLAPEQARGEEAGPAADIYALGVVTYQLLAGRLPYEAASLTELALKQQREPPPSLNEVNAEVRPELAGAVARALALEPAARYPDALAMERALEDGARGVGVAPEAVTQYTAPDETAATRLVAPAPSTGSQAREPMQPVPPARRREPAPPAPARAPAPAPARRGPNRTRRALVTFLVVAAVVGGGIAAVVASQSSGGVKLRSVDGQNAGETADQMRQLVDDNRR
jgi:serine/threonine-protein kinase